MRISPRLFKLTPRGTTTLRAPLTLPSRYFSATAVLKNAQGQGTKVIQPTLGVAAAMKAQSDSSFQPKAAIFDEFALKDGVAVVSQHRHLTGTEH
jgi:hypothetical protein